MTATPTTTALYTSTYVKMLELGFCKMIDSDFYHETRSNDTARWCDGVLLGNIDRTDSALIQWYGA